MKKDIAKLHYITQDLPDCSHEQLAELACQAGINWIQLRVKNKEYSEWLEIAKKTKAVCDKYNAQLIVNDNVQIAKEIAASGVHLGLNDINPREARKLLGNKAIIGGTANTLEDIKKLYACEVDYIGLGPYKFTDTKKNLSPVLGIYGFKNIVTAISYIHLNENNNIPLIAIGGINMGDVGLIMNSGAYGIAVSSAIGMAQDKLKSAQNFIQVLA
jgi:thiamine-phosphate pyrophosphorylase